MYETAGVCPDCGTNIATLSGPVACETCWRVVPLSFREADGALAPTGQWMRLPPALQGVEELVEALKTAVWVGIDDAGTDATSNDCPVAHPGIDVAVDCGAPYPRRGGRVGRRSRR